MIRVLHSKDMKVLDPKLFPLTSENQKRKRFGVPNDEARTITFKLETMLSYCSLHFFMIVGVI